ncbi:hypothetical protein [Aeromonas allosaccharophila]|uniref:hypothetical protein n=1 Tax=Aeromonas allosaccharophila TaxID=656 RepID=UPI003003E56A
MNAAINTIDRASIILTAGTQFRTAMIEDNVIDLMDLIERGVPFKTPIRLAKCNDTLYLTDGFHRIEAYSRLRMMEIPADQCVITDVATIEEVRVLAAGANVQHGKGNSNADYHNIIKKLMEFGDTYMKNAFEPDISKIAQAIGAAQPAVGRGYNNYPKDDYEARLSTICKAKRDAAVIEKHKDGMSNRAIAKLFNMQNHVTVANILENLVVKNPESGKITTPESPSSLTVPMASTLDRADTREDASAYIASQLSDLLDPGYLDTDGGEDDLSLTMDEDDFPPFDVLAATGYESEQSTHTKQDTSSSQVETDFEEVTAEELEASLDEILTEKEKLTKMLQDLIHRESRVRQEARIHGITLSK